MLEIFYYKKILQGVQVVRNVILIARKTANELSERNIQPCGSNISQLNRYAIKRNVMKSFKEFLVDQEKIKKLIDLYEHQTYKRIPGTKIHIERIQEIRTR